MQDPINHIIVNVTISTDGKGNYTWTYQSENEEVDNKTGKITLNDKGPTKITYALTGNEYNLIYVNLDADVCATREIHNVSIDIASNSITLSDGNSRGNTGNTPFSLRLVARVGADINSAIISPDPEVQNDPNNELP